MMTPEEAAKIIMPWPPVRPLDPIWLRKFLTEEELTQQKIEKIVAALEIYNKSCNQAAEKLLHDLSDV